MIINKSGLACENLVDRVVDAYKPMGREILVLLNNREVGNNILGMIMPRYVQDYEGGGYFSTFVKYDWDYAIGIPLKTCNLINSGLEAYYVYVLGHELGHAMICEIDKKLHLLNWLLYHNIREAAGDVIVRPFELHIEEMCDRYGLYIAEQIFGKEKLKAELITLIEKGLFDVEWNEKLLDLKSSNDFSNIKAEVVGFANRYRNELIEIWERNAELSENSGFEDSYTWGKANGFNTLFES